MNRLFANLFYATNFIYLIIVFLSLLSEGFLVKSKVPFFLQNQYCVTQQCENLAAEIESSLNKSADPCDDFYEFSCGGWMSHTIKPDSEPVWNHWQELSYKINDRIQQILHTTEYDEEEAFSKVKMFYKSCTQAKLMEDTYLENLRELIDEFGGWPIVSNSWRYEKFDAFEMIATITRLMGLHPVLNINVNTDYRNNSKQIIYIQPGNLIFPHYVLLEPRKYKLEMIAYKSWIYETIIHMYSNQTKASLKMDVNKLISFEVQLAKIMATTKNERTTVDKLSRKYRMDWAQIFKILFRGSHEYVDKKDIVVIKNSPYLKNVIVLFKKVDSKTIANYLIWTIVKDLSRETSQYMRKLNFAVDQAVLGTKADLSRRDECLNKVKEYFSYIMVPKYLNMFVHPNTIGSVEEIVNNMKIQFIRMLRNNDWLSKETKLMAFEKVKNIQYFVGYPTEINNESYVEDYYSRLNISEHHFFNILRLKKFIAEDRLFQLHKQDTSIRWPSNAFDVNGYYSILQNAIFIPLGLLEPPFFSLDRPDVFNYGAIGSLVGHEITHSLDSAGRHADKEGNIRRWWTAGDTKKYQERSECYEKHYSKFNINGYLTSAENIADNIGVKISFLAYESSKHRHSFSLSPHLAIYTKEQLFFISYAQMWCELPTETDLFSLDEHAPVQNRVLGTVHISEFFRRAFECKNIDNEMCDIW